jgi:hypothetical protein
MDREWTCEYVKELKIFYFSKSVEERCVYGGGVYFISTIGVPVLLGNAQRWGGYEY